MVRVGGIGLGLS